MEILNNFWNTFIHENYFIVELIGIPATFAEVLITMLIFIQLFKIDISKERKIIYVVVFASLSLLSRFILGDFYSVFFNLIAYFLCVKFIFKQTSLKSILCLISPYLFLVILEFIYNNFLNNILGIKPSYFINIPIFKSLYVFTIYSCLLLIYLILKKYNISFHIFNQFSKKTNTILVINAFIGIVVITLQSCLSSFYSTILPVPILFLNLLTLIAYFFISIYTFIKSSKLEITTQELKNSEEYNKTLTILHDSVRAFKHDFDNIVTTIGGYVKTDDIEGLKKYYFQLENDCKQTNNLYSLTPTIINNPGVYNLLTRKYHKADEKNIKINLTFLLDLNKLNMQIYEFTRILGILLDNAIEASSECIEKIINIVFRNDEKNSRQIVLIENTYNNKNVNIDKIFEKGISGKENHTGLGLWEVRQILNKNNNLNLHTNKSKDLFTQQLEIYY